MALMTVQELSAYLRVTQSTIYHWTHENFVPHFKVGDTIKFKESEIDKWLEKRRVVGRPKQKQEISV